MSSLPDLTTEPRALQVCKRPDPLRVAFASEDGLCQTLEGSVRYRRGDAIVTGARGERWPVGRGRFFASYAAVPPTVPGTDGTYRKHPSITLALRLDAPLAVPVARQNDPLWGQPGDWLLRYADGCHGVVQDEIFRDTYQPAEGETRWPPPP